MSDGLLAFLFLSGLFFAAIVRNNLSLGNPHGKGRWVLQMRFDDRDHYDNIMWFWLKTDANRVRLECLARHEAEDVRVVRNT